MNISKHALLLSAAVIVGVALIVPAYAEKRFTSKETVGAEVQGLVDSGEFKSANVIYGRGEIMVISIAPDGKKTETIYKISEDGSLSVDFTRTTQASDEELGREGFDEDQSERPLAENHLENPPEPNVNPNDFGEIPDDQDGDDGGSDE